METKRKPRKAARAWLIALVTIISVIVIGGFAISAAVSKHQESPVGFGLQVGGGPALYLTDELKCDGSRRHCSGTVGNVGDTVGNLIVVISWKDVAPQSIGVGPLPSGLHAHFSVSLDSRPQDIRDFIISFSDG